MHLKRVIAGILPLLLAYVIFSIPYASAIDVSGCGDLGIPGGSYVLTQDLNQSATCFNITADNVVFDLGGRTIAGDGGYSDYGIFSNGYDNITVKNGTVAGFGYGVNFVNGFDAAIRQVTATNSSVYGIYIYNSAGSRIINNTISLNRYYGGLWLVTVNYAQVFNNSIDTNYEGMGIEMQNGYSNYFSGNTLNSDKWPIGISGGSNHTFVNNNIWNCTGTYYGCIQLQYSEGNTFSGGIVNYSGGSLIHITGGSVNNNIFRDMTLLDPGPANYSVHFDYGNNANNTFINVTYANESVPADSQLIRQWYYRANVSYPIGTPAANISVLAYNISGALAENLTTNSTGWTPLGQLIEYVNTGGTRSYYSNYTINTSSRGYAQASKKYNLTAEGNKLSDNIPLGSIFYQKSNSAEADATYSVAIADLDNDGDLDYIAGNLGFSRVYKNDGHGNFMLYESGTISEFTMSVAIADLNNDGYKDYIAGNYQKPKRIYLNNGSGHFTLHENNSETGNERTRKVAVADLDNDGSLDYIVVNSDPTTLIGAQIYLNNGTANFRNYENLSGNYYALAVGDFNDDGYADFVASGQDSSEPTAIYMNNGSGHFTQTQTFDHGGMYTYSLSVADLDNDGHPDIIEGNGNTPGHQYNRVFLNNGNGTFADTYQSIGNKDTYATPIGDLDNDGYLDYISANRGGGEKEEIYLNDGTGNFSAYEEGANAYITNSIAVADLNGDGGLDYIEGIDNLGQYIYFNNRNDTNYIQIDVKGVSPFVNRDGVGTKVSVYDSNGVLRGYRQVTAADCSMARTDQLHFGLPDKGAWSYTVNATFSTGKTVSCTVQPPKAFTLYENGSSAGGVSCHVVDMPPEITSMQPANGNATRDTDINFTCLVRDDYNLSSVTIYIWNSTDKVYYQSTRGITGFVNQSSWLIQDMLPGMYKWNCMAVDGASKSYQKPQNYTIVIVLRNNLYVRLILNNTENTVYVPGLGESASAGISNQTYSNPTHFYLASYLKDVVTGLVFDAQIPRTISVGGSGGSHYLATEQDMENSQVFMVFTLGDWRSLENRIDMIESGRFLSSILPSFSYGLGNKYALELALSYADIDLQGRLRLQKGSQKIMIENNGTAGGRPIVVIRKE